MQNRRKDILKEAARLFHEQGYERTSVRVLAEAVNMQSGSLFYHFKTKEEILVAIMQEGIAYLIATLDEALTAAQNPRERLLALLRVHLTAVLEDFPDELAVYLQEWRSLSAEGQAQLIQQRDLYERRIHELLGEAAAAGLIRPDVKLFRLFLLGALNWTLEWFDPAGELSAGQLAERYLSYIVRD